MISKVSRDPAYHTALSILLAVLQLTLPGTPFLYQGDEMGLANYDFTALSQITDVEAKGYIRENRGRMSEEEMLKSLNAMTREHARVLLPWNEKLSDCHEGVRQQHVKEETEQAYRFLLRLRRESAVFPYGSFELISKKKDCFLYRRRLEQESYVIEANLGRKMHKAEYTSSSARLIFEGKKDADLKVIGPYGVRIWKE